MSKQHMGIQNLIFCGSVDWPSYCRMFYVLSLSNAPDSTIPFFVTETNIFIHWYTVTM